MGLQQHYPIWPKREIADVDGEMRVQDASARRAQRNVIVATTLCVALLVWAWVRGLDAGVLLFGVATGVLVAAFVMLTFVRRSIRRNFG